MVATLSNLADRRSRAVSLDFDERSQQPSGRPLRGASSQYTNESPTPIFAHRAHQGPTLPVAFTDNTVPVAVVAEPQQRPHLVPLETPRAKSRKPHFLSSVNNLLQTMLIAAAGLAIGAYGLDVVVSHEVVRLQDQARRLSEENTELSAQLLRAISYGELQESVVGRFALRVPEEVQVIKENPAPKAIAYRMNKHHLPLMSGY